MKKLLVLLVLLVSGLGFSQRNTDTTLHNPMFYGLNVQRYNNVVGESKYKLLNEWYKENIHLVYEEFIRLVNEERSHLTVNKKFVIYLDEYDYNSTRKGQGFKDRGDSVLFIPNKKEAKKLSKQIQEEYNVVDVHTQKIRVWDMDADRIWIEYVTPVNKIKFDSLTSLAALHHNKFFIDEINYMNKDWKNNPEISMVGHYEVTDYYPYHDTVIVSPDERVKYFTNDTRIGYGEIMTSYLFDGVPIRDGKVIWDDHVFEYERKETYDPNHKRGEYPYLLPIKIINNPYKRIAEELFDTFKNSPKHYEAILTKYNVDMVGMNITFDTNMKGYFTVNFVKEK